jgi:4-hydroxy 2-oxovalerate aldolase
MSNRKASLEHHDWSILDCTLRDGGYYTNWDFEDGLVRDYLLAMSQMPVSLIELGYVSEPDQGYAGQYFYLNKSKLTSLREMVPNAPPFAIMLNAKSCTPDRIPAMLNGLQDVVDTVRIACDPDQIEHGYSLVEAIKTQSFRANLNLMYLSNNWDRDEFFDSLEQFRDVADMVALVDSYGSCYPHQVGMAVSRASEILPGKIGFHGHDNISLSFANAISAIDHGATVIDSTVLGIGRGAGNLRTEILAMHLQKVFGETVDMLPLTGLFDELNAMKSDFRWGAELPYIVSGFSNLPQKDVMDWMGIRRYSTHSIVAALQEDSLKGASSPNFSRLNKSDILEDGVVPECILIGGGDTAAFHAEAIIDYAEQVGAILIHSSTRNIQSYERTCARQVLCIVGDEASKLSGKMVQSFALDMMAWVVDEGQGPHGGLSSFPSEKIFCVAPVVGEGHYDNGPLGHASPLGTALGTALALGFDSVWLTGFDGFSSPNSMGSRLQKETQGVLDFFSDQHPGIVLASLTPSHYRVKQESIYSKQSALDRKNIGE